MPISNMYQMQPLEDFFSAIVHDPRINTTHISLYMALLKLWGDKGFENPVNVFSYEVMSLCKVSGVATYHKKIRELSDYGYIKYEPSYYRNKRSVVYLL